MKEEKREVYKVDEEEDKTWRTIDFAKVEIGEYFYPPCRKELVNQNFPLYKLSDWEVFDVQNKKIIPADYDRVIQAKYYLTTSPGNVKWG